MTQQDESTGSNALAPQQPAAASQQPRRPKKAETVDLAPFVRTVKIQHPLLSKRVGASAGAEQSDAPDERPNRMTRFPHALTLTQSKG